MCVNTKGSAYSDKQGIFCLSRHPVGIWLVWKMGDL